MLRCVIHHNRMHNSSIIQRKKHVPSSIHMFIIIHKTIDSIAEITQLRLLIFLMKNPATSYVAATFHPTIGQRAHQSLSNTATPELGMIPPRIGANSGLHIAEGHNQQTNTTGFTRPSTDRPSQHSPKDNHYIPAAKQPFTAL